jgi:hypothetical protein
LRVLNLLLIFISQWRLYGSLGVVTGTATLVKATIGFQLGGQAFSQIMFFEDRRADEEFVSAKTATPLF